MKNKKNNFLCLIMIFVVFLTSCSSEDLSNNKREVYMYNWGTYIDPEVLEIFEEETGIKVNYSEFVSNEDLYTKLKSGGSYYDIVVPSDYMIEKMIKEDMLQPLNFDNMPNVVNNKLPQFNNLYFDPDNKYSVPYFWGTLGILYNDALIDEEVDSWNILWDEKYKDQIYMYDSVRDSMAVSLKRLGYSMNETDLNKIDEAKEQLILQKPLVQAYVTDLVQENMINEDGLIAVNYSGGSYDAMKYNSNLNYVIPKEGSNVFVDSIVMLKEAKNVDEAEALIDFLNRPEIAVRLATYTGYTTANKGAIELLPEDMKNNEVYLPKEESLKNSEFFKDIGDLASVYEDAWIEIKSEIKSENKSDKN